MTEHTNKKRENCYGCNHLSISVNRDLNFTIVGCTHASHDATLIVPHTSEKLEDGSWNISFHRVPKEFCPLPDDQVNKREKAASKSIWTTINFS